MMTRHVQSRASRARASQQARAERDERVEHVLRRLDDERRAYRLVFVARCKTNAATGTLAARMPRAYGVARAVLFIRAGSHAEIGSNDGGGEARH